MAKKKQRSEKFDLRKFLAPYIEKWYYFAIAIVLFGALGYLYSRTKQVNYKVNANVLITSKDNGGIAALANFDSLFGGGNDVDDEIFVISSHAVYKAVAKDLGLNVRHYVRKGFLKTFFVYKGYPIEVHPAAGIVDTLTTSLSFKVNVDKKGLADIKVKAKGKYTIADVEDVQLPATVKTSYGEFVVGKTADFPKKQKRNVVSVISLEGYDSAAEDLNDEVDCYIVNKRTQVISLSMITPSTDFGIDVLNGVMNEYNRRGIMETTLQNRKTAEFIEERLAMLVEELDASDKEILEYKKKKGVTNVELDAKYTYEMKGVTETALIEARTKSEILKIASDFLNDPKHAYDVMPVVVEDSKNLETAMETYNEMILKRMAMLPNAKEGNMALKNLTEQIDAMRASIIGSLDKAYENSVIAVNDLQRNYNEANSTLINIPSLESDFNLLYRERGVTSAIYQFLLKQREETAMILANAIPKGQVVDEAYVMSKPVGMSKKILLLAFLMLGFFMAAAVIYMQRMLKSRFTNRDEIEDATDVPILGEIGQSHAGKKLIVGPGSTSSNAELFRLMRANLQFILGAYDDRVVIVTSTQPGEGKSFISVNLAASLAMLNKKVLLVGMDIRKPRLAAYLDLSVKGGLTNYLSTSDGNISDYIVKVPEIQGLDVLTAGPIPPNPAELLASPKLDELFAELRERYDYIIVDTAPVGMVADTFTLDRITDATVYVTRVNVTTLKDLNFIDEIYTERRLKKLSVVINGVNLKKGRGYGYGYGYEHTK